MSPGENQVKDFPPDTHRDCSHNHAGPATITCVTFEHCGIVHRAVRFWRSDYLSTGKIEIYTLEPRDPASMSTELGWWTFVQGDFLRYADEQNPSRVDLVAMAAISAACPAAYHCLAVDQMSRFAAVEL